MASQGILYLIDGHSYLYRAFHAIRGLSTSEGLPTNAAFGFSRMLLKLLNEKNPEHAAVAFDAKGPSFRHDLDADYKAQRPPMPPDLIPQVPYVKRLARDLGLPVLEVEGYEADDILATLARRGREQGLDVVLVTGDKDLLQLVSPHVTVYDPVQEKVYGPAEVEERFGVGPERLGDVLALMGDASDNIPGVPGVGPKTATKLIREYGDLETLLARAAEVPGRIGERLRAHADQARLSRLLVTLDRDVPLDLPPTGLRREAPDTRDLAALLRELEFTAMLRELALVEQPAKEYRALLSLDEIGTFLEEIRAAGELSLDLETTSLDPMRARIVGVAMAVREGAGVYIPLGHTGPEAPAQPDAAAVLERLAPILTDPGIRKVGQNIKYDMVVLRNAGLKVEGVAFDTMIAAYLLNPGRSGRSLDDLAMAYLDYRTVTYDEVTGTGRKRIPFAEVPVDRAAAYAAEDAEVAYALYRVLAPVLEERGLDALFREVEMPLIPVLAEMELRGVKVDADLLASMSRENGAQLEELTARIHAAAGEEFNINSTQQLGRILFDKLGIKPLKKTKTGYSTNVEVLEQLAADYELPRLVLEYRTLNKLKTTYVDALPRMIHPGTGRIHTSFNQAATATGRLSSSEPNLQNIPIRTPLGRRIREAFVAEPGCLLISADYSQIELRVLAHLSGDERLVEAFRNGEDIHTRTAVEIFGLPADQITPDMRRDAKVVNFGIIYGMGAYGLARQLDIAVNTADDYIRHYFERHPGVRAYQERIVAQARERGYVTTLLGRQRPLPGIVSLNKTLAETARRTAVNTPIQGSAADLIKVAMLRVAARLEREGLKAGMVLQIHDELLVEAPEGEVEAVKCLLTEEMEGVHALAVPLTVDVGVGRNWEEAH